MDGTEDIKAILTKHEFLAGIDERCISRLAELSCLDSFHVNDYVFRAGEKSDKCFLIREGQVALEVYDPSRGSVRLETLSEGKVLGWSWLIPPYQWCFDARALLLTRLISLDATALHRAMETDHDFGYLLLKRFTTVFAQRLHAARLQLMDMYGSGH